MTFTGWHKIGYDHRNTSRYPDSEQIRKPSIAWQMDISACEYLLSATLENGISDLELQNLEDLNPLSQDDRREWGLAVSLLDVLGDGQLITPPNAPGARWGKFLPDVAGHALAGLLPGAMMPIFKCIPLRMV